MREDIKQDGKFRIAGELSKTLETLELHENIKLKGDEIMNVENVKVINMADRRKKTVKDNQIRDVKLGQVYYVTFRGENHIQRGRRPAVVVQNNIGNQHSTNIQVIPLTTSTTKASMPTHVILPANECGLRSDSIAQCEMQTQIDKSQLEEYVTKLPTKYMGKIGSRSLINTPALAFLSDTEILGLMGMIREKNHIVKLNAVKSNPNPKEAA
jgi:mRNA interferase MazF